MVASNVNLFNKKNKFGNETQMSENPPGDGTGY